MDRLTRRSFLATAGLAAPALGAAPAQAQARGGSVAVEKNVVFGKGGDMDLRCDLYRPAPGTEKRMATIHLHGGGFTGGSKDTLAERIQPYAAQGYLAIASQYRGFATRKCPRSFTRSRASRTSSIGTRRLPLPVRGWPIFFSIGT